MVTPARWRVFPFWKESSQTPKPFSSPAFEIDSYTVLDGIDHDKPRYRLFANDRGKPCYLSLYIANDNPKVAFRCKYKLEVNYGEEILWGEMVIGPYDSRILTECVFKKAHLSVKLWLYNTVTISFDDPAREYYPQILDPDVILRSRCGVEFPVHKSVLRYNSIVFLAMFRHPEFKEGSEVNPIIDLPDASEKTLETMLKTFYNDWDTILPNQLTVELLIIADKYILTELKQKCTTHLSFHLNSENVLECAVIANLMDLKELQDATSTVILCNYSRFKDTPDWNMVRKFHPGVVTRVMTFAIKRGHREPRFSHIGFYVENCLIYLTDAAYASVTNTFDIFGFFVTSLNRILDMVDPQGLMHEPVAAE